MTRSLILVSGLGALLLAGCSDSNRPDFKQTFPVKGKVVSASGSAVTGGRIELHPENPDLPEARGMIKSDGTFVLGTYKVNDGVAAGQYAVTIDPLVYDKAGNLKKNTSLAIPKKYADPKTSGIKVEIKPEPNDLTWKLN